MDRSEIRIHMKATCTDGRFPGVWTVIKINPKTIKLEQGDRTLNAAPSFLRAVEGGDTQSYATIMADLEEAIKYREGCVVRFSSGRIDGLFVITNVSRDSNLRLFPLGGSPNGRYYRGVSHRAVEIVDVDELLGLSMEA